MGRLWEASVVWPHVVHCIFGLERGVGRKLD